MKILILNGPNLNMLGVRNPKIYGSQTLDELNGEISCFAKFLGIELEFFQSNSEGTLIDVLQSTTANGVVFNAGALSHYSYALRDCIECLKIPVVSVHLSDISNREDFRKTDVLADVCVATFFGKGKQSYILALEHLAK